MTNDGPIPRSVRPGGPVRTPPTGGRPGPGPGALAAAIAAVVVLVVLGAALAGPWRLRARRGGGVFDGLLDLPTLPPQPVPTPQPQQPQSVRPEQGDTLTVVVTIAGVVLLVVLLVVLGRMLRRILRERRPQRVQDDVPPGFAADVVAGDAVPAVEEGLHAARQALEAEVPPGDAVIAAWMALEHAAEASGVARVRAQTPTEFTVAVLDRTRADPAATRGLLDVYLQARFSSHPLTDADVATARAHLARLADGVSRRRDDA